MRLALATIVASLALVATAHAASPGVVVSGYDAGDIDRALATGAQEVVLYAGSSDPALTSAVKQVNGAGRRVHLIVTGTDTAGVVASIVAAGGRVDRVQPPRGDDVDRSAALLRETYDAVKRLSPTTQVFATSADGADPAWVEQLLARANGKLDGVAISLASSCATDGPDKLYRESDGRLGRFTFVGFLEVLKVLGNLPLAIPVMGVSSTNGGPTSCARGTFAGKKPSGVSEAAQARILKAQFECLANYPQVTAASWFRLEDTSGDPISAEFDHYGLYHVDGTSKPALATFKAVTAGITKASPCADLTPPAIHLSTPERGYRFEDTLDFQVRAADRGGVGLARISLYVGNALIRNYTQGLVNSRTYGLRPWLGSRRLPAGTHTLRAVAVDKNGNRASISVTVEKVARVARTRTLRFTAKPRVRCAARTCTASFGRLTPATRGGPSPPGKVAVAWQWRDARGRWHRLVGADRPATKSLAFTATLPRRGMWRVRATYPGGGEYKAVRSPFVTFAVA